MRPRFTFPLALALVACSDGLPTIETEKQSFSDSPYQYCLGQDERWLIDLLARVRNALPENITADSLQYERMHVSDNWMNDVLDRNSKELVVRFTANRNGEEVQLFTLAGINPETCELSRIEGSVGQDRFADRGNEGFKIP